MQFWRHLVDFGAILGQIFDDRAKNEKIRKMKRRRSEGRPHDLVGGGGWARRGFWSLRIRRFAEYGV